MFRTPVELADDAVGNDEGEDIAGFRCGTCEHSQIAADRDVAIDRQLGKRGIHCAVAVVADDELAGSSVVDRAAPTVTPRTSRTGTRRAHRGRAHRPTARPVC